MAIPAGITTALVHLDAPISFIGDEGQLHVSISSSVPVIWGATGTPLANFIDNISPGTGIELAVELPHTDQDGFLDGNGNAFSGWSYIVTIKYEKDGQLVHFPEREFQIPSGQTSVDLALVPAGESYVPVIAPILPVTSIAGFNGAVTLADLDLERVDNTNDAEKPISAATQAALDTKQRIWRPGTVYFISDVVVSPLGELVKAKTSHTSGVSYVPGNWASVALGETVVLRTNLAANPSAVTTAGYGVSAGTGGAAALTNQSSGGHTGATFNRATWSAASTAVGGGLTYGPVDGIVGGKTYTFSAWVRPSVTQKVYVGFDWNDTSWAYLSTSASDAVTLPAGQWTRVSVTAQAPATAIQGNLAVFATAGGVVWPSGAQFDIDDVLMVEGLTAGTNFDGNTPAVGGVSYEWTGAANASVSREVSASTALERFVTPGTVAQYYRGDKTWATLNKAAAGLGNVDNTSDANKPMSIAAQAALDAHVHPGATAAVSGFMSATDKTKLDAASSSNTASALVRRDSAGNISVGTVGLGNAPVAASDATRKDYVDNKVAAVTYSTLGVVPTASLPPLAINDTFPVASQAAMLALTAQRGDMAIRTDNGKTYVLATDSPSTLADWKEIMAAGQVQSVAGKTGVVALVKADVGLSNVDNTADTAKPISALAQTALDKLAKGLQYRAQVKTASAAIGGTTVVVNNIPSFTFKAGRKYRATWDFPFYVNNVDTYGGAQIATCAVGDAAASTTGLTEVLTRTISARQSGFTESQIVNAWFEPTVDTTVQLKFTIIRVAGTSTIVVSGAEFANYTIEDLGSP